MSLFGYFSLGLRSMSAAQFGLQVAGENIANAFTPGYARRRAELSSGSPVPVTGGFLGQGVEITALRRMEDRFLQASLDRELGAQAGSEELLRGLRQIESIFGTLDDPGGIAQALTGFAAAFDGLAAQPEDGSARRGAVAAADRLASSLRDTYGRLENQRRLEDQNVGATVQQINQLADELAGLNQSIGEQEAAGAVSAPLRDRRENVLAALAELTGGSATTDTDGRVSFSLAGGPTLVTADQVLPLGTSRAADGTLRISSGADGSDITGRIREGRLGSLLAVRDDAIPASQRNLDQLAGDLILRANALTTSGFDATGAPGIALFQPDPLPAGGAARTIAVNAALVTDPSRLAVSADGTPGDSTVARQLAALSGERSAALGDRNPTEFLAGMLSTLGEEIAGADVAESVSRSMLDNLEAQRASISGVSLDEEAVALIQNQRAFEAAARFIDVLNNFTEIAVNLVRS